MNEYYFSDRENGALSPENVEITQEVWFGILALVNSRIDDGSFGNDYPEKCDDGGGIYGTNRNHFIAALKADIPSLGDICLLENEIQPDTLSILDLIEFCYRCVTKPIEKAYHLFFKHPHFAFNKEEGQWSFRENINRIFSRNGLVYELGLDGQIKRLVPQVFQKLIESRNFQTGDGDLDNLLNMACSKFLSPDPNDRKIALEKLWDAWERLKSIYIGQTGDKKSSTKKLLDDASREPQLRDLLEKDAASLTQAGNDFHIRHFETTKTQLDKQEHVDYLFYRLFSLIHLLLRTQL